MLKLFRVYIITILCLVSCITAQGQRANVWCFGKYAGLNFNYNPPKPFESSSRRVYPGPPYDTTFSTSPASISDCSGNLLFYTTAHEVFNRFNQVMPHGTLNTYEGSPGNCSMIIPIPNDSYRYYVFHGGGGRGNIGDSGLFYSIVDMRLDSGRGDITNSGKSVLINDHPCHITITKQAKNINYLLITLPAVSDSLYTYLVTAGGVSKPVKQKIVYTGPINIEPSLRITHKGDRLLIVGIWKNVSPKYGAIIYSFNNNLGTISGGTTFFQNDTALAASCEFSANDSFIYICDENNAFPWIIHINQFETYSSNPDKSKFQIYYRNYPKPIIGAGATFQLGPDNKIYFDNPDTSTQWLGCISNPNKKGYACGFILNDINLAPSYAGFFMPNLYFPVYPLEWLSPTACADTVYFNNNSDTAYFKSFTWYYGDGDSATTYNAKHQYNKSGKYLVRLLGINSCGARNYWTDTVNVTLPPNPGFAIDSTIYFCGHAKVYIRTTATLSGQTYAYNFGDSIKWDSAMNFVHNYKKSGTYTISQAVFNGNCYDTLHKIIKINIEPFPIAAFTTKDTIGCPGFPLQLQNNSINAYQYNWIFDDGTTYASFAPVHHFSTVGYHSVKLIASNNQGCEDSISKDSFVDVIPGPATSFSYTIQKQCNSNKITFTNTSANANNYLWDFGDGSANDTATDPTYLYTKDTTYSVKLIAYNQYCNDSFSKAVNISLVPVPVVKFSTSDTAGCSGIKTTFTADTNASSWYWYFGDSTKDSGQTVSHSYTKAGNYSVSLKVFNSIGCADSVAKTNYIKVVPFVKPAITIKDSSNFCGKTKITFKSATQNTDSVSINFGDSVSTGIKFYASTNKIFTHSYTISGNYKAILTAKNQYCSDTQSTITHIFIPSGPKAAFQCDTTTACAGAAFYFHNQSTNASKYLWNFSDGTTDSLASPQHPYNDSGEYTVILIAKGLYGCIDTTIKNNYIKVLTHPQPQFSANPNSGCLPLAVSFSSSTNATSYKWNFGDADSGAGQNVSHTYYGKGDTSYKVGLNASNGYCSDTASTRITITTFNPAKDTIAMRLATVQANNKILVLWNKHPLASKYEVQRSLDNLHFKTLTTTPDSFFVDDSVKTDSTSYYYKGNL